MRRVQELVEGAPRVIAERFSSTTGNQTNHTNQIHKLFDATDTFIYVCSRSWATIESTTIFGALSSEPRLHWEGRCAEQT